MTDNSLYKKINWCHTTKDILLEPIWKPTVIRVLESGDVVQNPEKNESKNKKRKEFRKYKNNLTSKKIVMSRKYYKRLKQKKERMEKILKEMEVS